MIMTDRRDFLAASLMGMAASFIATQEANAAPSNKPLIQKATPAVNLDGWQISASEVTYPPGESSGQHRHPGFVIGYVLEGQYKFAVNNEAPKVLAAGEMFFESFDAPGQFEPQYESWTVRREPWLVALDAPQYERER